MWTRDPLLDWSTASGDSLTFHAPVWVGILPGVLTRRESIMSAIVTAPVAPVPAAPPRLTAEEFLARYADQPQFELVEGVVKEAPMPWPKHGFLCARMTILIGTHVATHDLGHVMSNDSFVKTGPDTVRGADVCFWSYERQPRGPLPEGLLPMAPDLVVEVKSPSDSWTEHFAKVVEYLRVGVRVILVVDSATATVSVYRPDLMPITFRNDDVFTLPDVLPGFSVPLAHLFA
jgi:Uma2 family endonuclease